MAPGMGRTQQIDFKEWKRNEEGIDGWEHLLKGTAASAVLVRQDTASSRILRRDIAHLNGACLYHRSRENINETAHYCNVLVASDMACRSC